MNRLTKTDSRRGTSSQSHHPSARAAGTAPVARSAAARAQDGSIGVHQDAGVGSSCAPRMGDSPLGGWWPAASHSEGLYPPGGFTNYLQSSTFGHENFHFVGAPMSQSSVSPNELGARRIPSPSQQTDDPADDVDAQEAEINNMDEDLRTDRRLNWSVDEDKRLASAWLLNLKDPVDGNGKKADKYWQDVTEEYNKTTENSRKRNRNQLKIRWDHCKKPLTDFHGVWVNSGRVWQSGMSDDQMTDRALEIYAGQNNGKAFYLVHMWKVVRGEQKWSAYLNRLKKEQEKQKSVKAQVVNLELDGENRPIGHKKAKNERNGTKKAKTDALADFSVKLDKYIEATNKNREDREKMTEVQQSLADKKIEAARINHEAAHEQTKCKMLETYTQLLLAPTEQLSADALAERKLALESLRLTLFPK